MAINQSILDLTDTPLEVNPVQISDHPVIPGQLVYSWTSTSLIIQNIDGSATVYLGDETVASNNYGITIPPGGTVTVDDLTPTEVLWALSSGSSQISVLYIQR